MPPEHAIAVIPARHGSTRFPGKPLADRTGKPLIQHVYERAAQAKQITKVIVATDDQRIFDVVARFGGHPVMTRADHTNGTSRIAEAITTLPGDPHQIIVNVQGDEPELDPAVIDKLINGLRSEDPSTTGSAPMATLSADFAPDEDPANPNIVKLVTTTPWDYPNTNTPKNSGGGRGGVPRALYFSRSLIPFDRDGTQPTKPLKHPGLYAYRRSFLLTYVDLPATPLETAECLEQLRALEHGYPIAVVHARVPHHGIDTPEQYEAFVRRYRAQNDNPNP